MRFIKCSSQRVLWDFGRKKSLGKSTNSNEKSKIFQFILFYEFKFALLTLDRGKLNPANVENSRERNRKGEFRKRKGPTFLFGGEKILLFFFLLFFCDSACICFLFSVSQVSEDEEVFGVVDFFSNHFPGFCNITLSWCPFER